MKKKLLTIEDLVKFCREQKMFSFNSKEHGEPICVALPAAFEKKDDESETLMFAIIKAFHTGRNRNSSSVTVEAMENSKTTFAYKPILAAFTTDKNGDEDFMAHEMDMDDDGNIIYIEKQVGCFTTDEPWIETDPDDSNKQWVYAKCAIPREYTHAAEIIERKGGTKVSVELIVNEFSYDENEDLLLLKDIEVSGLTLLGVYEEGADPDKGGSVEEGMEGARLDISDFSRQKNSPINYEELTSVIKDAVSMALQDINNKGKEENNQMNHFEELLQKYGKTAEEIAFAYEGLSDEELDKAFAEAFEEAPAPEGGELQAENVEFSITYKGESKNFARSLNEQIKAISELVNAQYSDENTWYDVEVFDDHTVYMHDWWNNKHFKQKYGNKDGELVLKGERTELFVRYLTEEEIAALDDLKSKFDAKVQEFEDVNAKLVEVTKELDLYKEEPEKVELLSKNEYAKIRESAEYKELAKRENYFSLSQEEITQRLDSILLGFAKQESIKSAPQEQPEVSAKRFGFGSPDSKSGRYGGIFKKN